MGRLLSQSAFDQQRLVRGQVDSMGKSASLLAVHQEDHVVGFFMQELPAKRQADSRRQGARWDWK